MAVAEDKSSIIKAIRIEPWRLERYRKAWRKAKAAGGVPEWTGEFSFSDWVRSVLDHAAGS